MKLITKLILCLLIVLPEIVQAELLLMDEIKCVVCGPAYNKPFTDTDITWKRTLQNEFIPLQKQIQADIVQQQIITEKMPLDPEAVGKYIDNLKKQLKMNDAELNQFFGEIGRTMLEGIDLLNAQYASEFFTHYKFKSQLVPTDDEIEEYFNEYPEFIDGYYQIQVARIPFDSNDADIMQQKIDDYLKDQQSDHSFISWSNIITINVDDLAHDQEFVTEMQPGQIHVKKYDSMFELVRLVAYEPTKLKPLSERKSMIIEMLNRKKMEKMFQNYNETIKDFIDIITFDQTLDQKT